jgi:8-oxo-dGTP pyrophosphatase MutT (NUDIX family)
VFGIHPGAAHVAAGSSRGSESPAGLQPPWSAGGRGLLWRRLPIPFALSGSLARLRERLAHSDPSAELEDSLVWAAVAIILAPGPDALLLIRRAERLGDPWSGHMALPGGRREPGDPDLLTTSIREVAEEVGIELTPAELAGTLEDVVPRTPVLPPIAVRPFVFLRDSRPVVTLNPEATSATWAPLARLLQPDTHHLVRLEVSGTNRLVQAYELADGIVWGMTERILTQLLNSLQD